MLRAALRAPGRALLARSRGFAAPSLATTPEVYGQYVDLAVKAFETDKAAVTKSMEEELAKHKVVLFMDGHPDAPKSTLSLNAIKMLTEAQAVPLMSIDVTKHPAILGYTVSKTRNNRAPHLYVNGAFYGDHDTLLSKHASGELKSLLGTPEVVGSGPFKGELPIASY